MRASPYELVPNISQSINIIFVCEYFNLFLEWRGGLLKLSASRGSLVSRHTSRNSICVTMMTLLIQRATMVQNSRLSRGLNSRFSILVKKQTEMN